MHKPTAAHRALSIYEVCNAVFEQLDGSDDVSTVYAASLVCHVWAAAATKFLWQCLTLRALYALACRRRLIYAPAVKSLTLLAGSLSLLHEWTFPHLNELVI